MMFGERASESPRVPSPWTRAVRTTGSRSSSNSQAASSVPIHRRALQVEAAPKSESAEDAFSSSPLGEDDFGFFALDTDLDLSKLDLTGEEEIGSSHATSSTATPASSSSPSPPRTKLAPEPDAMGNLEYKLRLLPPTRHRYDRLLTQLKWRLLQGGGQCTYEIGVLDDGRCVGICLTEMRASLRVLASLASELGGAVRVRRAFALVQVREEGEDDNDLRCMNNKEAKRKLGATSLSDSLESVSICGCKQRQQDDEEVPWMMESGRSAEGDQFTVSEEAYRVEIDECAPQDTYGVWLNGMDKSVAEAIPDPLDQSPEDEEFGYTYSLSLDEMATRQGAGYQRNTTGRRRCRVQDQHGQRRRQKDPFSIPPPARRFEAEGKDKTGRPAVPSLRRTTSNGLIETGVLQPCDEALPQDIPTIASISPCERVIVEAIVSKEDDAPTHEFIDYASL